MRRFRLVSIAILVFALGFGAWTAASGPERIFRVGGLSAKPGQAVSGFLDVPAKGDPGAVIPVTLIQGSRPGPVLACVAGVHGSEYPPILALFRVRDKVDPAKLSGTLILVHIANVPSFSKRTIYYNPFDWKNLNRVFPGDPNGSLSQRMADVINTEVISRCDDLLDLHGGDANEDLMPYTYWMVGRDAGLNERSKALALDFGLRHVIIDDTKSQTLAEAKYLGNTALLRGKPAITTETGALGRSDEEHVRMAEDGVLGVMRGLGMIEGRVEPVPDPVWIDKYEVINSSTTGLFVPTAKTGESVTAGMKLGSVNDLLGRRAEDVRAPFDGIILYVLGTPPVSAGEPLLEVGHLKPAKH